MLHEMIQQLDEAGIDEARRNAEWMLGDVLGCSRAHLYAYPERKVPVDEQEKLSAMVARRLRHEPLQYILGYADFFGLRLHVSPAVLIPRPETEQVVEVALSLLNEKPGPRVLDIGTGSGCIPLVIKKERPDADVYACDVSEDALAVATRNAEAHDLTVRFFQADALTIDFLNAAPLGLDLLISNPPYIADREGESLDREVRDHEPHLALFAGDDPLMFYRAITRHAATLLAPGGWLVFETHAHHADEVVALMGETNFDRITLKKDLAGLPRIVQGQRKRSP